MICRNQNSYSFDETIKTHGLDAIVTFLGSLFYGEENWCKNVWDVSKYLKNFELFYGDGIFSFLFFCAQLLAVLGVCSIDMEMEFSLSSSFVHNSWQY